MTDVRALPPTVYYGVEKCNSYDMPQTRIRLFRNKTNAQKWFELPSRVDYFDADTNCFPFYKVVYKMPWYFRFPLTWKMDAWIEENRPSRKDWWSQDDVRGELAKICGKPEVM